MSKTPKFTWAAWNYNCAGEAYIIAKRVCPEKDDVPSFIVREDGIRPEYKSDMVVEEGWCKWQVRTDWMDSNGEPRGSYVVIESECDGETKNSVTGKRKPGWFPVWIVRKRRVVLNEN